MKKILLLAELPDNAEIGAVDVYYRVADEHDITVTSGITNVVKEIVLPIPVQINEKADEYATVINSKVDIAFADGALWIRSLLT